MVISRARPPGRVPGSAAPPCSQGSPGASDHGHHAGHGLGSRAGRQHRPAPSPGAAASRTEGGLRADAGRAAGAGGGEGGRPGRGACCGRCSGGLPLRLQGRARGRTRPLRGRRGELSTLNTPDPRPAGEEPQVCPEPGACTPQTVGGSFLSFHFQWGVIGVFTEPPQRPAEPWTGRALASEPVTAAEGTALGQGLTGRVWPHPLLSVTWAGTCPSVSLGLLIRKVGRTLLPEACGRGLWAWPTLWGCVRGSLPGCRRAADPPPRLQAELHGSASPSHGRFSVRARPCGAPPTAPDLRN